MVARAGAARRQARAGRHAYPEHPGPRATGAWLTALSWLVCGVAVAGFFGRLSVAVFAGADAGNRALDLGIYLDAAAHLQNHLPIYQVDVDPVRHGWPYVYPPLLAEAFLPFDSYTTAWWVWTALSLASWLGSLGGLLWTLRGEVWRTTPSAWRPILLAGLVLWPAVLLNVNLGQAQLVLLGLLCASWWVLAAGHARAAGALLGAAIALKPLPAAALVSVLAARHWRAGATAVLVAGLLMLLSFGLAGWDQARVYVFEAAPAFDRFLSTNPNNRDLATTLMLLLGPERAPAWLGRAIGVMLLAARALVGWLWRPSGRRALALGVSTCLLANTNLQTHYLILALLPMAQAYADAGRWARPGLGLLSALLAVSSYVLPAPEDAPPVLAAKSGLPVAALLALFIVECLELRRFASARQPRAARAAEPGPRLDARNMAPGQGALPHE